MKPSSGYLTAAIMWLVGNSGGISVSGIDILKFSYLPASIALRVAAGHLFSVCRSLCLV
jgi:hypothetical protein